MSPGGPSPPGTPPRRAGDPAVLVASGGRVQAELGWQPRHTGLDEIVADAWAYLQSLGERQRYRGSVRS
ncbi:putative UDP-glucose 4-epimerase [Rhodococcus opacus B4]|uniref:Putative UDP-glucose 4-epimerase n=1 Tax=Rhodococcus opacus (strain B4) TaxID=632772 RepID=C1AWN3_RHOOB|nr:putative UDP-glucose 4-epimerase [Rhodococcus opacus B4]